MPVGEWEAGRVTVYSGGKRGLEMVSSTAIRDHISTKSESSGFAFGQTWV